MSEQTKTEGSLSSGSGTEGAATRAQPVMDPALKSKWVEALRSGAYQQGKGKLRGHYDGVVHCCLGVLCEVGGIPLEPEYGAYGTLNDIVGYQAQKTLWRMNDNHGKSFAEIADYIEANL